MVAENVEVSEVVWLSVVAVVVRLGYGQPQVPACLREEKVPDISSHIRRQSSWLVIGRRISPVNDDTACEYIYILSSTDCSQQQQCRELDPPTTH